MFRWHQDYPYTQGSLDGVVGWVPLFDVAPGEGCLRAIPGSHTEGVHKVRLVDPKNQNLNGPHTIEIPGQESFERRVHIDVSLEAGDALICSALLLHRSTPSINGQKIRWTIQLRYANFLNRDAVARGWSGGMIEGEGFDDQHPEFIAQRDDLA